MNLSRIAFSIAASGLIIFSTSAAWADPPSDSPREQRGPGAGERGDRERGPRDGERGREGRGPRDQQADGRPGQGRPGQGRPGQGRPGQGRPGGDRGFGGPEREAMNPARFTQMMPVLAALDADKDGVLSKEEIGNATAALQKLDKNSDGQIDFVEMRPNFAGMRPDGDRPGMRGGPGGPREGDRRPGGDRPRGDRPGGDRPGGDRPGGDRPGSDRPSGDRPGEGRGDGAVMAKRLMELDKNDDGELTADELPERAKGLMKRLDRDESGSISREELSQMRERGRRGGNQD